MPWNSTALPPTAGGYTSVSKTIRPPRLVMTRESEDGRPSTIEMASAVVGTLCAVGFSKEAATSRRVVIPDLLWHRTAGRGRLSAGEMTKVGNPIRVLELRSVRGPGGGPEKTILAGGGRTDPARAAVTVCYLRDRRDPVFAIDGRAANLGVEYVEVRERHSFDPSIWRPLVDIVRSRGIDIVHAHDYKTDVIALALARVTGAIPLSTVHGWIHDSWRERYIYTPADSRLLRWYPRVIAVSEVIRSTLVAGGVRADRITTVLNGIDSTHFRRDPAQVAGARRALGLEPGDI